MKNCTCTRRDHRVYVIYRYIYTHPALRSCASERASFYIRQMKKGMEARTKKKKKKNEGKDFHSYHYAFNAFLRFVQIFLPRNVAYARDTAIFQFRNLHNACAAAGVFFSSISSSVPTHRVILFRG